MAGMGLQGDGLLRAVEARAPVDAVDAFADELRRTTGASSVSLLVTNMTGSALVRLSHVTSAEADRDGFNERVESVPLDGSAHDEAMRSQALRVLERDGAWQVLVPLSERGDAIGLLELWVGRRPTTEDEAAMTAAAHALVYVLIATRRHTDLFEWAQRDRAFTLAAEIQRRLLPSAYTLEAGAFTLAGWLEPANDVGGDTFDYSLDREHLYLSITDAMGHGIEASLLATLAVGSLRNTRRGLAGPAEQAEAVNEALLSAARVDQFVTGQVGRIRLADGRVELVNAGHPKPYLLRDGHAAEVEVVPNPPFGVTEMAYAAEVRQLRPGDRLLLLTDGFLERKAVRLDLSRILAASADLHPREVVRELAGHVVAATGGRLQDDATVLCLDWHGSEA